ncbi:MAG: tungstate ABC transporter substrate-binding protein WtpA [Methanoregulaceae archaeon]|jgi:molybdate/tungstate transport system substrate-binding protein|nr:tungstate ABC transporter substrate-binding protein WtpA [Methanoregulaceae archaeon]MDD3090543.1 tungstate ABC transporter substrate-binding protein WtpA [Methanoregulaceae archaeon]MDD5048133.1 tungstate ABC transporter substrate-binding protein WtpA [Methanoregulaceae archaeon]MDD5686198.1 tungstate ABC transporter substrate-binding protein WtpA [Methanoregulaceae archaeon]HPJ73518.1 tungstate ABC transporter substrate-binding protein WtpA [Methanoregulaceae archaeon]
MVKKLPLILALFLVAAITLFCGCVAPEEGVAPGEGAAGEKITVKVFHAGSLTGPFEKIKAEFEEKYPNTEVLLEPAGSVECVKKVTETGKPADVVASADYALIPQYMVPDDADWYLTFAKNTMTLAYTDQSRHASEITADNWYAILGQEGVRWAFSDPNADPCGYRTPMVIKLAEGYYGDEAIFKNLVEDHSNIVATFEDGVWTIDATDPAPDGTKLTIRPKSVELVQMVQAGGIDYAWEYRSVAVQNGLKFIELPEQIDLSAIEYADNYKTVKVKSVKGDDVTYYTGSPIVYGVTVPKIAEHPEMGLEFVKMLIGPVGQAILTSDGQPPIIPAGGYGDVPAELSGMVAMKA